MVHKYFNKSALELVGYAELERRYGLDTMPNWHNSFTSTGGIREIVSGEGVVEEVFPEAYRPGDGLGDHLEFALKYDGTNLATLSALFRKEQVREPFIEYVRSRPTGKYSRRLWFLYEFLTGDKLPIDDLKSGNYVDLLEPDDYYTVSSSRHVRRQRINNNLLGDRRFCPTVRRTDVLRDFEAAELPERHAELVSRYPSELLKRAFAYLYTKETRSSFEIERVRPSSTRSERFIALLRLAEREDFCLKERLLEIQNQIVDPRFQDSDYRSKQNYVGETIPFHEDKVHFVPPKPDDLHDLMDGLLESHGYMDEGDVSPVVHAAVVAWGFVFLHPFEDGNGRIHRFLIHNILARRDFTPEGAIFPVSAVMLEKTADYDASLEAFSRRLMPLVEHSLDMDGRLTVHNDTEAWYRYIDMTAQAEALFYFIDRTINTELVDELEFLDRYDKTKRAVQEIVDMPDQMINLFIRFCLQNGGRLSARKRASHFSMLSDEEIARGENAVRDVYGTSLLNKKS